MKRKLLQSWRELLAAPLFSPRGFVMRALALLILYGICEILGWREETTFISGTPTSAESGTDTSIIFGVIYLFTYFAAVLAAPVLLLGAGILSIWQRISPVASVNAGKAFGDERRL